MNPIVDFLAGNPLFLLFLIIGVGYLLGSIRVFGFSLGVAAVLFVGIAAGALITTFVAAGVILVGHKAFKLPLSAVTGVLAGIQTQPARLAYANQQAENELPNIRYATVYPASMVAKIHFVQILVSVLILL